jgi:Ran GTPase-activating protein (RanGAP) involved in mRNA processing and transport
MSRDEFLWVEKYRPRKIEDCILPDANKKTFMEFLNNKEIPNLMLAWPCQLRKNYSRKSFM